MGQEDLIPQGVTAAFNKSLNEALLLDIAKKFNLDSTVTPSVNIGILKGSGNVWGVPAAISAGKSIGNYIGLSVVNLITSTAQTGAASAGLTATATKTLFTVPTGKYWVLKNIYWQSGNNAGSYAIKNAATGTEASVSAWTSGTVGYLTNLDIPLGPGDIIEAICNLWTSGDFTMCIIYTEDPVY